MFAESLGETWTDEHYSFIHKHKMQENGKRVIKQTPRKDMQIHDNTICRAL